MAECFRQRPDEGYDEPLDEALGDEGSEIDMIDSDEIVTQRDILSDPNRAQRLAGIFSLLSLEEQSDVFRSYLASLSDDQQFNAARVALASLSTASLAAVFRAHRHRLHIDPTSRLPFELVEITLQALSPRDAVQCSTLSKRWRSMALDSQLWKLFYLREGWRVDTDALETIARSGNNDAAASHRRKHGNSPDSQPSRKRQRDSQQASVQAARADDPSDWVQGDDPIEADEDQVMRDTDTGADSTVADSQGLPSLSPDSTSAHPLADSSLLNEETLRLHDQLAELVPPIVPNSTLGEGTDRTANWYWLYKQRRRLESNWDHGRYQTFQLPRPEFPLEGHDECVYSIQFSGDFLVSGSRDKTIKIWSLATQRCLRTLTGQHEQSVLCLQFCPKDDIVISGGSDSYIVIWQFSTGKVIKRMTTAHRESVLNLRFDDRYLITCSKDKTIKIWNRHTIMSNDPIIPQMSQKTLNHDPPIVLKPYSLLGVLGGHGAAVNAIQIFQDTIVSASGDRSIRMWDIQTGECLKKIDGHTKGIACVQFDGRRVVSGSSDNTVRIFDAATQGEVACLQGHANLVRTVQARFGDKSVTDEEMEALARQTQEAWVKKIDTLGRSSSISNVRPSLDGITDVRALNTKIPIGGGGTRWSRIVSGSYDESVIIWKKDTNGKWLVNRRLTQEEILASGRLRRNPHANPAAPPVANVPAPVPPAAQLRTNRAPRVVPGAFPGAAPAVPSNAWAALPAPLHRRGGERGGERGEEPFKHRVFKLQFDARRIVCCSQNRTIVGWDFANGDAELMDAAGYFAETD